MPGARTIFPLTSFQQAPSRGFVAAATLASLAALAAAQRGPGPAPPAAAGPGLWAGPSPTPSPLRLRHPEHWHPAIVQTGRWLDGEGRRHRRHRLPPLRLLPPGKEGADLYREALRPEGFLVEPAGAEGARVQLYGVLHGEPRPAADLASECRGCGCWVVCMVFPL